MRKSINCLVTHVIREYRVTVRMASFHCVLAACVHVSSKKRQLHEAQIVRRKTLRVRRRAFARRQSQECLFALLLCVVALNLQSPIRSVWMKQRSSYWWEHVINQTFIQNDWIRMSREIFIYLCDEFCTSVEKNDTIMR